MADQQVSKSQLEMASQLGDFVTTLFQVVGKSFPGNMCISPFSVASLLAMVHAGAKGCTAQQLEEALGIDKFSEQEIHATIGLMIKSTEGDENIVLKAANLCYVAEDKINLKEKFKTVVEKNFGAQAIEVNFDDPKTREKINDEVEELTNKKIKDLLSKDSIGQATVMVLVNAVYFKGDWLNQFDSKLTEMKPFYLGTEKCKVDVEMMRLTGKFLTGEIDSLDAEFIVLPYKGLKVSMTIILPNKIDGLLKVECSLSGVVLDEMEKSATQKKICVELPKFKIETTVEKELMRALREIGIEDLFEDGVADLSGISDSPGLFASNIVQKVYIKVDEKGAEAAAATAVTVVTRSAPRPPSSFKVDRPAIFLVKDNVTKLILFVGRLANPAQK